MTKASPGSVHIAGPNTVRSTQGYDTFNFDTKDWSEFAVRSVETDVGWGVSPKRGAMGEICSAMKELRLIYI